MASSAAHAQDVPQADSTQSEIVVTAQRRQELARDVPITVTNLSGEQLAIANVSYELCPCARSGRTLLRSTRSRFTGTT
jgi:hypothetical protein